MNVEPLRNVGTQRLTNHQRSEIRATNTDVHNVRNRATGVALPNAIANLMREALHVFEHALDIGHDVLSVNAIASPATTCTGANGTQGDMHDGTILGRIDVLARKHCVTPRFKATLSRQRNQQ